jgi:ectoine hydroxylase-related dioxygenase (phytanoyl-CoA dioxygenase family)
VLPGSHRKRVELHGHLPEPHGRGAQALDPRHAAASDHPGQSTLSLSAGDAVVIDYRLLHGTHANESGERRDCVLLSFTPSWRSLPSAIRGHLIDHLALPSAGEQPPAEGYEAELLPRFDGVRRSLRLNRIPPGDFAIVSDESSLAGGAM